MIFSSIQEEWKDLTNTANSDNISSSRINMWLLIGMYQKLIRIRRNDTLFLYKCIIIFLFWRLQCPGRDKTPPKDNGHERLYSYQLKVFYHHLSFVNIGIYGFPFSRTLPCSHAFSSYKITLCMKSAMPSK